MIKKILLGIVVIVVALFAFNFITTGKLALIPSSPLSAEGRDLMRLEDRFTAASHDLYQAERSAGMTGMDTTADAEAALDELAHIERALLDLKEREKDPAARDRIDKLLVQVQTVQNH